MYAENISNILAWPVAQHKTSQENPKTNIVLDHAPYSELSSGVYGVPEFHLSVMKIIEVKKILAASHPTSRITYFNLNRIKKNLIILIKSDITNSVI